METTHSTPDPEPTLAGGPPLRPRRWLAVGAATLALMSAGFGISVAQAQTPDDDTTTTTEAPDATTPDAGAPDEGTPPTEAELQAFRDCMADNGVDLPDERPAPGERPERTEEEEAAFEEALEACEDLRPEGFGHRGGPGCDRPGAAEDADEGTEPGAEQDAATGS